MRFATVMMIGVGLLVSACGAVQEPGPPGEQGPMGEQGLPGAPAAISSSEVIMNGTSPQTASFNITGDGVVAGMLGVGTSEPEYTLDVKGSARIAGLEPFIKGGNNGTATCDEFCQDPQQQWGASGVCVGGGKILSGSLAGKYITCTTNASQLAAALTSVACFCAAMP